MAQTFYIESDEEIISAIGRLRHSPDQENYFVFPKRALILQSIINLRLFQKEAQKMNKTIIIVTQDEIGRMLAEKSGIRTETYSDEFAQKANHLELKHQEQPPEGVEARAEELLQQEIPHVKAEAIGSSSFFTQPPKKEIPLPSPAPIEPVAPPKPVQQLRIRNVSPERPPGLNSMRTEATLAPKMMPDVTRPTSVSTTPSRPLVQSQAPIPPQPRPVYQAPTSQNPPQAPKPSTPHTTEKSQMLKNFFANNKEATPQPATKAQPPIPPRVAPAPAPISPKLPKTSSPVVHGSAKKLLYFFGFLSLLSVSLLGAYLFFPKVTVKITPFTTEEKIESSLRGVTSGGEALDSTQVRLLEREIPVTITGTATDSSASTTEKARGTIVIYNDFSAEAQSLVATTRLESPDGKIFRLQKSIVVPGKTSSPGAIEADVIADQAGESYNIDPTTFTIPGFKGNPKFDKFSGKSVKKMSGGGSGGSEVKSIARADLDKAEADARVQAETAFMADLENSRVPGEFFLKETLELTPLESGNRPKEGLTGATFEYQRTFKAKAFLIQENMLKQKIEAAAQKESNGIRLEVSKIDLDYGEISPNYTDSTVGIRIHALIHKKAILDSDSLKTKLLGQDAAGIQAFLGENPSVQKVELDFKPKWFGTSIPKSLSRVDVVVVPVE